MSKNKENNYAFVDSQNLYLSIKKGKGWILDFKKFRQYLKDRFSVEKAFLFIGYINGNSFLYTKLQQAGYIVIFKPTLELPNGEYKGNCDADLVLHTMIEYNNYDKAVIVSGDGDFHCLVEYLINQDKLKTMIIPNEKKYSSLLRKFTGNLTFLYNVRGKLEKINKKEASSQDKTF